ncbi:MAG: Glycosyl transferase group 1 [Berkelbacteria bacterium GW2011_GWA2_46_7]|uniref:Glycosyl transferase group 1 n=1 Tax=Berkelbacteria bacterium GW2011_GWA2_46_7 TaxID=1618335 RepID=A0A0G1QI45_9BACT|nr:MAG: Glycosyl transferase group 1 [Berkelbacteria bacterium GW2011_GWA2_46_7]
MKIALVHDFFTQWGGGERVLKTFSEIWPEAPIYLIAKDQKLVDEFLPNRKIISSFLQDLPGMPKAFKYYIALMPKAIESFDLSEYDVVLSDSSAYAKGVITKPSTKHICYLHTPTRYLTSDKDEYLDNAPIPLPIIGRPVVKAILRSLQKWDLQASKRPDYLIANSKYIAERTKKYYGRTPDEVLFPPVDTEKFKIADRIGDYWLTLGRNEPYKRTDLAILAANRLGLKLKVVGGGTKLGHLQELAGPTVEFLGRVSDDELADLYARAIGLIFPPKEDAGMTPLEAMASGRPVIAYGEGGALESVVAGVTGEFFKEQTVESLVATLKNFDASKYDPQKIRAHAMEFDAEKFKEKIKMVVKDLLT